MNNKIYTIGCDEVGYGCIAGPLTVYGVKAPINWNMIGLNDSKKLSSKKREALSEALLKQAVNNKIFIQAASIDNKEIDRIGLGSARKQAFVYVFKKLYDENSAIICDGNMNFSGYGVDDFDIQSIVKADSKVPTVMAASILAKVLRDLYMVSVAKSNNKYDPYDWASNKGYGTKKHMEAIKKYGLTDLHRKSYKLNVLDKV